MVCLRVHRGLAQCALAQGDTCQALHHYGELVSKALMGRGSAEHWAYAEYGWLLFQVRGERRREGSMLQGAGCARATGIAISPHALFFGVWRWVPQELSDCWVTAEVTTKPTQIPANSSHCALTNTGLHFTSCDRLVLLCTTSFALLKLFWLVTPGICCVLCVQEGNADAGRYQLETAINTYRNQTGLLGSDTVLAGYHLKLGR